MGVSALGFSWGFQVSCKGPVRPLQPLQALKTLRVLRALGAVRV